MEYNVGGIVRIKNKGWYDKQKKDKDGNIFFKMTGHFFGGYMVKLCGKHLTVKKQGRDGYIIAADTKGKEWLIPPEAVETCDGKDDSLDDKLRWDLLPLEDIEDIVKVYHAGAKKYGPNKWQELPDGFERYKAAMLRHLVEYEKGNQVDPDTGCYHLAQVAWNAIAMLHLDKKGKGTIPLPPF